MLSPNSPRGTPLAMCRYTIHCALHPTQPELTEQPVLVTCKVCLGLLAQRTELALKDKLEEMRLCDRCLLSGAVDLSCWHCEGTGLVSAYGSTHDLSK